MDMSPENKQLTDKARNFGEETGMGIIVMMDSMIRSGVPQEEVKGLWRTVFKYAPIMMFQGGILPPWLGHGSSQMAGWLSKIKMVESAFHQGLLDAGEVICANCPDKEDCLVRMLITKMPGNPGEN